MDTADLPKYPMKRKIGINSNKNKQIALPSPNYIKGTNDSCKF